VLTSKYKRSPFFLLNETLRLETLGDTRDTTLSSYYYLPSCSPHLLLHKTSYTSDNFIG
jgi:hypothetical protein